MDKASHMKSRSERNDVQYSEDLETFVLFDNEIYL